MYKKDYLQRQFEEFGKVLAMLLGYRNKKDWDRYEKEMQEASLNFTSLDINHILQLDEEAFKVTVVETQNLLPAQKKILAALMFDTIEFYAAIGKVADYKNSVQKCRALYRFLQDNLTENEFDLEVHYRIQTLEKLNEEIRKA